MTASMFGVPLSTLFQGGILTTLLAILGVNVRAWIVGAPARKKASSESDASLRRDLLDRIGKLEEAQATDRANHAEERRRDREECEKVTDELRERIREQDRMIDGLQRQLIMYQVAAARALPLGSNSTEIETMLSNLDAVFPLREAGKSETLRSAEETCHAAEVTVEQVKQDEITKAGEQP